MNPINEQEPSEPVKQPVAAPGGVRIGSWEYDTASGELRCSASFKRSFGRSPDGGFSYEDLISSVHPEDRPRVVESFARAVKECGDCDIECRVIHPDGEVRRVLIRGSGLRDGEGDPCRLVGIALDVTRETLLESETQYRSLVEASAAIVWRAAGDGSILEAPAWAEFTGQTEEEYKGFGWLDTVHPEDREPVLREWEAGLRRCRPVRTEYRIRHRDGGYRWVEMQSVPVLEKDESVREWVGTITDVDERKKTEVALRRSEELLRAVLDNAPVGLFVLDREGVFLLQRGRLLRDRGLEEDRFVGRSVFELYAGSPEIVRDVRRALAGETFTTKLWRDETCYETVYGPLRDDDGEITGVIGVSTDVTERERAEREREMFLERERTVSRALQRALLPPSLPEMPGAEIAGRYVAAGEGVEVGGDFYDVFSIPEDGWALVIGDVTGKGPEAAALTSLAHYTVRAAAARVHDPQRVLAILNEEILKQTDRKRFFTIVYGEFHPAQDGRRPSRLSLATGGHPPPVVLRADGEVETLHPGGMILGVVDDPEIGGWEIELSPGDVVVLYTDGVIEARNPDGAFFGEERLRTLIEECRGLPAQELAKRLEEEVMDFQQNIARDDIAILVLRCVERD